jgi:hypothetical protein
MTESRCASKPTAFRNWRKQMNLSTTEAAAVLGKTTQMINILDNAAPTTADQPCHSSIPGC